MRANEILTWMNENIAALSLSERMIGAGLVTILSMAIVFLVLVILMGSIKAMEAIFLGNRQQEKLQMPKQPIQKQENSFVSDGDEELVAVLSAAVAAAMESNPSDVRVVHIVKVTQDSPVWAKNSRIRQINSRL